MAVNFALPRSIPWITQQVEPGVQARTLVDERFDAVADMVAGAKTEFDQAIAHMNQSLAPIIVGELSIAGIEVPDLGGDIPTFTDSFDKTFTATLDEFDVEYVEPGGKPDSSLAEWEEGTISLEPELIDKLAVWLTTGETAIPDALVTQIYNAAEMQLDEKRAEAVAIEESKAAARGFEIPSGIAASKLTQIEREYAKASAELSAALANKNMELTQTNFHKAIEVAEKYVTAAKDYIVRKNVAKIQWYSASVDAWIKQVDAAIKVIDAKVSAFNGKVEAYKAQALAYKTEAEVFDSSVKAYIALVDGLRARISAIAETVKMKVEVFKVESTAAIEEEKLKVSAQTSNQALAQKIAEAQSSLHAQMVASGLSAMHVQASISSSHGTGQDVRFGYSYSEGMSEGHTEAIQLTEK
jgi:hypothetical protein